MTRLKFTKFAFLFASLPLAIAAGCATRKAAATQTTTPFDVSKSEPKAVTIADEVIAALGGQANWDKAKQIEWSQAVVVDGSMKDYSKHAYDRWEGRHRFSTIDNLGQMGVVMREIYGQAKYAYVQGKARAPQMKEDTARMADTAQKRLDLDGYRLFIPFKLKDPGVHLAFSEERPADDDKSEKPTMKIDVIKITFDPNIGPSAGDTWYLAVDKATHIPLQIEHVAAGRPDTERSGIRVEGWRDAGGGLKFPTKFTNVGYHDPTAKMVPITMPEVWKDMAENVGLNPATMPQVPSKSEIVFITQIKVSDSVDEDLYVPNVNLQ